MFKTPTNVRCQSLHCVLFRAEMRSYGASNPFPEEGLVYDFCFDQETLEWVPWMDTVAPYK